MFQKFILAVLAMGLFGSFLGAAEWNEGRSDEHAPIGVMGDHFHQEGEWMVSYRYMSMAMEGLRSGSHSVSTESGLGAYMMVPESMQMDMHMVGAMYGVSDAVTVMVMLPYLSNEMDIRNRMGQTISRDSEGVGDVKLSGLVRALEMGRHRVHMNVGVSLPTGAIDETGPDGARLPYPMQLGSGSIDLMPGITWVSQQDWGVYGMQVLGTIRTGQNAEGYTLGNRFEGGPWVQKRMGARWSVSGRLTYLNWGKIQGRDMQISNGPSTGDEDNFGGSRVDAGVGVNFLTQRGHRFAAEYLLPVFQDLNGLQLELDSTLVLGWQYAF